jgi:hypothetical protein
MAIISIPSSVGGVSIPGNLLKGPLAKLFKGGPSIATYSYPRDLGSATRGHWITFSINEIIPTQYDTDKVIEFLKGGVKDAKADMAGAPANQGVYESAVTVKGAVGSTVWGGIQATNEAATQVSEKTNLHLRPQKKEMKGMVALYMPDGMSFTNSASYGNVSLLEAAKSVVSAAGSIPIPGLKTISGLLTKGMDLASGDVAKLALSTQGLAINPGQQLLFDGIDFRTYSLSFTFTPFSKEEAQSVKDIIKLFKTHAAPRITDSGMFFIPPSTFNLDFYKDGKINDNVARVAESVIESIEVNYAPNGWATHTDGAPVQTTLTMNFKEIELIDRAKIEFGGY